jgi:hypothetical protein
MFLTKWLGSSRRIGVLVQNITRMSIASAAHPQRILPAAGLVGGSASAVYAGHRLSADAAHVGTNLRQRFDQVLADPEAIAGWQTVKAVCADAATQILEHIVGLED